MNGNNNCGSWAKKTGYSIGEEDGKNILTNKKDGLFTIKQIEVWQIMNVENLALKNKKL